VNIGGCKVNSECDDGVFCNGREVCFQAPVYPGLTLGVCADGTDPSCNDDRDNDCDGQVDENCQDVECVGEVALYPDNDGDGFGAAGASPVNACTGARSLSPLANDCDDTNPAIKPGASVCNGNGVRTCGSTGTWTTRSCLGAFERCMPQADGTGVCFL
jgi:hypothetical protein